jgi:hypothetical protein
VGAQVQHVLRFIEDNTLLSCAFSVKSFQIENLHFAVGSLSAIFRDGQPAEINESRSVSLRRVCHNVASSITTSILSALQELSTRMAE